MPRPRPELLAGGYTRNDGVVEFFGRVQALLPETGIVLDFGAGRGAAVDDPVPYRRRLQDLRGPGRRVVAVDLDPIVLSHPTADQCHVLAGPQLPLDDESVQLVLAHSVFEHVQQPEGVAAELCRVLAPGGWICALTPNLHGYIALGARLVPNRAHVRVLRVLQPTREARDIFPTAYAMNTRRTLERLFPAPFVHATYGHNVDPVYFQRAPRLGALVAAAGSLLPEGLSPLLMVFIHKPAA